MTGSGEHGGVMGLARGTRRRDQLVRRASLALVVVGVSLVSASGAQAAFSIDMFTTAASNTAAGAHADVTTTFAFPWSVVNGAAVPSESARKIQIEMPAGLMGDPSATPRCPIGQFTADVCPDDTKVGTGTTQLGNIDVIPADVPTDVYNLVAPPNEPARLGLLIGGAIRLPITLSVRAGSDYGLTATIPVPNLSFPLIGTSLTLWGVPADNNGGGGARKPFMTNPTNCDATPVTTLRITTYSSPTVYSAQSSVPVPTDCASLAFDPAIHVLADNPVADQPTGLAVDLGFPQNADPDGRATAHLKRAVVVLPEGFSINPGVAFGKTGCEDAAFGRTSAAAASCPASSKVGTVGFDVPILPAPIPGDIYLGTPKPGNPFRLFLYAEGYGVRVKVEGSVIADPVTGRLSTVFEENPQNPVRSISLRLQGGPRAVIATSPTCGPKTTLAGLSPWSGNASSQLATSTLIGGECADPQPFAPTFAAGTTSANAGGDTGFVVQFGRPDGNQTLSTLKLSLPAGLLGRLADFPLCPIGQSDANACSDDSLVGYTTVSAGSGGAPLNVTGKVFLTEPPKAGQIAGLAIVVPALAGPYDLGTPIVHAGIRVNPDTSLSVESDPLPTILQGVPLRIKQVTVSLDRPGFMFNPTDCSAKEISGSLTSVGGTQAPVASPFQVGGCADLPFAPKVTVGTAQPSKDGGVTGLRVHIVPTPGGANMRTVNVTLPKGIGARLDGPIQTPCKETEYAANACPDASRVGEASASTPVLTQELRGPVYLLENKAGGLPKLAIRLKGQVDIDLVGAVTINSSGRIVTSVPNVPDVPISSFDLMLEGGSHAALVGAGLCSGTPTADLDIDAQSAKKAQSTVRADVMGCAKPTSASSKSAKKAKKRTKHRQAKTGKRRPARRG